MQIVWTVSQAVQLWAAHGDFQFHLCAVGEILSYPHWCVVKSNCDCSVLGLLVAEKIQL